MNANKPIIYNTRDAKGNDIIKEVVIKKYATEACVDFKCMCGNNFALGVPIKKIVSSNFTDWGYVSDIVCQDCADMFSFYRFSFIRYKEDIKLLNIREMAEEIQRPQQTPFKIVVSKSQKKHLFYKAMFNHDSNNFVVNLEEEQISCNLLKLQELFLFVGSLQVLGQSKEQLKSGEIRYDILLKIGSKALSYLQKELKTRQIQIPLYLSQKLNVSEGEAVLNVLKIC